MKYILLTICAMAIFVPFILRAQSSTEIVSVTAIVGGGGVGDAGGGGGGTSIQTGTRFSGYAYPYATVHILRNTIERMTVQSDQNGYFTATIDEQSEENIFYTLYAVDRDGVQSLLYNYPLATYEGYLTHIQNIKFAPTFLVDKLEVREGDYISVSGYALPSTSVVIDVFALGLLRQFSVESAADGRYNLTIPLTNLDKGEYNARAHYGGDLPRYSNVVRFVIGANTIPRAEATANIPGDCNVDQQIDIVDFSVFAFWYGKKNPPVCVDTNGDGVINLVDFSILAFHWTS